jgi:hypothetical protein
MRLRIGVVFFLLAAYVGIGCRSPLTPNIDRNQAPETWITAAPFDTITIKDDQGHPIGFPFPGTIPVRFHMYWAGADKDGAVSGFYWAVVETLPRPVFGPFPPSLPGPKPQDYHFTTKTDSFFVFDVAEDIPDRQHAFYIYAVDNLGKPDPTPARFIFNAQDRFPPIPIIEECRCVGTVYTLRPSGIGVDPHQDTTYVTDFDDRNSQFPRDTCASRSTIHIKWHGEVQVPSTTVTGYRYKLDEPTFVEVGPEVHEVTYYSKIPPDTVPVATGRKIFTLRVVDQAFGTRDSTRRFQLNYSPDTWFAGPDMNSPSLFTNPVSGEKYVALDGAGRLPGPITGSLLSHDSTFVLPASRPAHLVSPRPGDRDPEEQRATFFEVWKDTIWARQDGDTVHMNSWIVLHGGGFDKDSPYLVKVNPIMRSYKPPPDTLTPNFPDFIIADGPVLQPSSVANGSPIGFRSIITMSRTPDNSRSATGYSNLYPVFDPNDVASTLQAQRIGGYHPVFQAGRAFAVIQAVDGDGDPDKRITDGRDLVDRIESGLALPAERSLRSKVLSFYVDKPPYFVTDNPLFRPRPTAVDTFTSSLWDLRIVGDDVDPYNTSEHTTTGGPSTTVTLRVRLTLFYKDNTGIDRVYQDDHDYVNLQNINLLIPSFVGGGPCTLRVELCDCEQCELEPGTGRCVTMDIPVYYRKSAPAGPTSIQMSRPGSEELHPVGAKP